MKKRVLSSLVAGVLAIGVLAGCGSNNAEDTTAENNQANASVAETENAGDADNSTVESKGTITVAASATPHAEILEAAKSILADEGWDLQVTVFNDYVQPNEVVESGEFDANYFQHIPY